MQRRHILHLFLLGSAMAGLPTPLKGGIAIERVAFTQEHPPNTPVTARYKSFNAPVAGQARTIAFHAHMTGISPVTNTGIFVGTTSSQSLVVRTGDAAPGTEGGVSFGVMSTPALNDQGQVAFMVSLQGPGVAPPNRAAIYGGSVGSIELIARDGSQVIGLASGIRYLKLARPLISDGGHIAFAATLGGSGVNSENDTALLGGPLTSPLLLVRAGDPAPLLGPGVSVGTLGFGPSLNDSGHFAYAAVLTGSGVTNTNNQAMYAGPATSPRLVARRGQSVPDGPAGATYSNIGDVPSINDSGAITYRATIAGGAVTSADDFALFAGPYASQRLVAREGTHAHGAPSGVEYSYLYDGVLNDRGAIAYRADLKGGSVNSTNDQALFAGPISAPTMLARNGDAAPGTGAGVIFAAFFDQPAFNDAGQLAVVAKLAGSGVTADNDHGLFAYDPVLGLVKIAREGDPFDVGGGDIRIIASNNFSGGYDFGANYGRGDDTLTGLSDDGRLTFLLGFPFDGSEGIFVATIPEPAQLWIVAPLLLLGCRFRLWSMPCSA